MKLQISELARQTGVSVRTLHYYDTIGLLKPTGIDRTNGWSSVTLYKSKRNNWMHF